MYIHDNWERKPTPFNINFAQPTWTMWLPFFNWFFEAIYRSLFLISSFNFIFHILGPKKDILSLPWYNVRIEAPKTFFHFCFHPLHTNMARRQCWALYPFRIPHWYLDRNWSMKGAFRKFWIWYRQICILA